jgi:hypothetical protein
MTIYRARNKPAPTPPKADSMFLNNVAPPMDALCECGMRYGMHRVNDLFCPNQEWKPGNGKLQWLSNRFKRSAA